MYVEGEVGKEFCSVVTFCFAFVKLNTHTQKCTNEGVIKKDKV